MDQSGEPAIAITRSGNDPGERGEGEARDEVAGERAGHDRGGVRRGSRGSAPARAPSTGLERAAVVGDLRGRHALDRVRAHGLRIAEGQVDRPVHLRRGAGEVELRPVPPRSSARARRRSGSSKPSVSRAARVAPVGDRADRAPHGGFGAARGSRSESAVERSPSRTRGRARRRRDSMRPRAVTWAQRSPPVSSGVRTLRARSLSRVSSGRPSDEELHDRDLEPLLEDLARLQANGRGPPMSGAWAVLAANPRSPPSRKTGFATQRSGRCPVPIHGSLVMRTSPGASAPGGNSSEEVPHGARQGADEGRDAVRRLGDRAALPHR